MNQIFCLYQKFVYASSYFNISTYVICLLNKFLLLSSQNKFLYYLIFAFIIWNTFENELNNRVIFMHRFYSNSLRMIIKDTKSKSKINDKFWYHVEILLIFHLFYIIISMYYMIVCLKEAIHTCSRTLTFFFKLMYNSEIHLHLYGLKI